jgi:hypothetical protein
VLHHRLLDVHVLARLHGVGGNPGMPVVRGGDDHGVDIRPGEHLAVVARGEDVRPPQFLRPGQAAIVDVRHGNQLDARHPEGHTRVAHALPARADEGNLQAIAG